MLGSIRVQISIPLQVKRLLDVVVELFVVDYLKLVHVQYFVLVPSHLFQDRSFIFFLLLDYSFIQLDYRNLSDGLFANDEILLFLILLNLDGTLDDF